MKPSSGISRRAFLKYCSAIAGSLCLEATYAPKIARALASPNRPPVVWLHFSECTGCTESFLRSAEPDVGALILERISVDYHETLMAAAGHQAEAALAATVAAGNFLCVAEGAIPTAHGGIYGQIGSRTMLDIARDVVPKAKAVLCMGTCASFGGLPAAGPNPTGCKGVGEATGVSTVNIPGCPPNPFNLVSTIVNHLLFGRMPEVDSLGRPRFAYGEKVHDDCPKPYGCLKDMGCKGEKCRNNCHQIKWNGGRSWDVQAGHHCIGCAEPEFWDRHAPFYSDEGMDKYRRKFGTIGAVSRREGEDDEHEEDREREEDWEREEDRKYAYEDD
jgi:[NiFe] hydrogenase small subunit